MGLTTVVLEVASTDKKSKKIKAEFMVDSGSFYTVLPKRLVIKLGIKPEFDQQFSLADGTNIKRQIGNAFITFQDKRIAAPVILGEKEDTALMGALTLENLGLILNPFTRKLHPAKMVI
jgi:clan AA aspartic protease